MTESSLVLKEHKSPFTVDVERNSLTHCLSFPAFFRRLMLHFKIHPNNLLRQTVCGSLNNDTFCLFVQPDDSSFEDLEKRNRSLSRESKELKSAVQ